MSDAKHEAPAEGAVSFGVDDLAQEIRRVDGNHSLGAGALAEALLPFLSERLASAPAPSSLAGGEAESRALDWMEWVAQGALDTDDVQLSGAEIIQHAEIELASIRKQAALSPEAPAREGGEIGEEFDNAAHCVTLADCPPGLFLWNGSLGFKSEYGAMEPVGISPHHQQWKVGNRADAYCADSGEYFWGGTSTHEDRAKVLVYPIDARTVAMVASHGPAALTPRHEAPAEDPVPSEWTGQGTDADFFTPAKTAFSTPAEGAGEALLPCPFCGGDAEIVHIEDGENEGGSCVCCTVCQASGNVEFERKENFISNWNRRARSSAPEGREEALGNLLAVIHGDGGHRALEVGVEQAAAEAEKIVAGLFAAPNADKLRDALKETWDALTALREAFASDGVYDGPKGKALRLSNAAIRSAASALKTEGAVLTSISTPDALKGDARI